MKTPPVAFSYVRFSSPQQARGDSLRRQLKATTDWCEKNGVTLDATTTLHDLGKSAFTGAHRTNPDRNALAAFLKMVEDGKVSRGSYLIIESLDRLTREHVRAGLMLCLGLIEHGVRIVQLSPTELVYDEKSDELSLMLMVVELSRGHRESKRKSDAVGAAWAEKKRRVREGECQKATVRMGENSQILTRQLPAWIQECGGRLTLIPERAEVVRLIFRLSAAGYGNQRIAAKLTRDGVRAFGNKPWEKGYIGRILRDRRAVGDLQPKGRERKAEGDPVPGYYPAAVTEGEYLAAKADRADRKRVQRGRVGSQVNVFAKLIRDARGGGAYYMTARVDRGNRYYVLSNLDSAEGRAACHSFPYAILERAVCSLLSEVKPHEVMGREDGPDEVQVLSGQLADVESSIRLLEADLDKHGDSPALYKRLRAKEAERADMSARLDEARRKAAHPLSASWGEAHSLLAALDAAPDPEDARLRLRSALRRVVEEIRLLVVPRGRTRLAAVQVYFSADGHRDYLLYYRPPQQTFGGRREGECWAKSLPPEVTGDELNLRDPGDAAKLETALAAVPLDALRALMTAGSQ